MKASVGSGRPARDGPAESRRNRWTMVTELLNGLGATNAGTMATTEQVEAFGDDTFDITSWGTPSRGTATIVMGGDDDEDDDDYEDDDVFADDDEEGDDAEEFEEDDEGFIEDDEEDEEFEGDGDDEEDDEDDDF